MPKPLGLASVSASSLPFLLVKLVHDRVIRDTDHLRLVIQMAKDGEAEEKARWRAMFESDIFVTGTDLANWAAAGEGDAARIPALLHQFHAYLTGISSSEVSSRGQADLTTVYGVAIVAAEARLAVVEGRTVSAVELATLASVDEHTLRAAVKSGVIRPLGPGRPMRFAADAARVYLYTRGVRGFAAPEIPPA